MFLARNAPATAPRVALFANSERSSLATLSQLSGHSPASIYNFADILNLHSCICISTITHNAYRLPPLTATSIQLQTALAIHVFLQDSQYNLINIPASMPSIAHTPSSALHELPSSSAQYLLVSNLFLGHANRSLQMSDMLKLAANLHIDIDVEYLMNALNPDWSGQCIMQMFNDKLAL